MIYVFKQGNVIFDDSTLTDEQKASAIVVIESLPEPDRIEGKIPVLRVDVEKRSVYYEYMDDDTLPNQEEPVIDREPTIEEKLDRMEKQLEAQQQQSLTILDVNLTLYEEVLNLREEIVALKETGNV